jgi:TetR/AcrR family transcriptional regulator
MDKIFKSMDTEKKDRIINSALEEFSKNGFDKASTNEIVKNAGISKGLLFHYFESKKRLYSILETFAMEIIIESISKNIDWKERDFFLRLKQIIIIKASVTNKYPYIYEFLKTAFEGKPIDAIREFASKESEELSNKVYTHNIDLSMFKEGIDIETTMSIIRWTFDKFGEENWKKIERQGNKIDIERIEKDSEKYIKALREAFYK